MIVNHKKRTIEMSQAEEKKATKYGSDAYNALVSARHEFPNYNLVIAKHKTTKSDAFKGLTFNYMTEYIENNGSEEQKEKYLLLRNPQVDGLEMKKTSYDKIKKWFLAEFPKISEYNKKVESILNEVA